MTEKTIHNPQNTGSTMPGGMAAGRTVLSILVLSLCLLSLQACSQLPRDEAPQEPVGRKTEPVVLVTEIVPEKYLALVEEALELAGENREQIEDFLKKTPPEQREAASFLVAYMPPSDLACASAEALREHLDYAFATRDLFPWSKKVAKDFFHHYVLPCRVTQEPFEQWRKYLFDRVHPRIKHLETMEDVALEINRWCKERFTYKPTQARDQGIFENLKRGIGRCEEMMILYICAARSVGIPARSCSTPLWSTCNSNHAWVEVWCDGKWYYLGACEPADTLNTAWFTLPAQRAPLVLSKIYGVPEGAKNVYRTYKRSAIINSTSVYAETGKVKLDAGKEAEVYFYVFNYGSLRPFSKREADKDGKVEIELGPGEYIFTVSFKESVTKWGKVKVLPGKDAQIEYGEDLNPEGHMWLRYPKKSKLKKPKKEKKERKPLPEYEAPPDTYAVKHFEPKDYPKVMEKLEKHELKDKVVEALKKSLGNCDNLAEAIRRAEGNILEDLLYLLTELPALDLIEATPELLFEHIKYALSAFIVCRIEYDEETRQKYVLNPRISYEPLRAWRKALYERFEKHLNEDPAVAALAVNKWLAENVKEIERGYAGSWKDPLSVVISRCGRKGEINGCAVGILRALGVPAKLSKNKKWVEFHDGKEWHPLYPLEPEHFKSTVKSEEVAKEYEKPGTLSLTFRRKGLPMAGLEHFAALKLEGSYWSARWPDNKTDEDGKAKIELAPGDYLFNAGVRNMNGDPFIFLKRVTIESGKEVRLDVVLDIPLEHPRREDLVVREMETLPDLELKYLSPTHDKAGPCEHLWVFFTLDNEPCKAMLPIISKFAGRQANLITRYVYLGFDKKVPEEFDKENSLAGGDSFLAIANPWEAIRKLKLPHKKEQLTRMPSIVLVGRDRKIFYWGEGHNLAIDQTLKQALELMRKGAKKRPKGAPKD